MPELKQRGLESRIKEKTGLVIDAYFLQQRLPGYSVILMGLWNGQKW